jgi:Fic-DOC domain mobile mystery protein B
VSDPLFELDDDANTPLTPEEQDGLIPTYITARHELNEAEQTNIGDGERWALSRRRDVLNRDFLTELHQHMFGDVWSWAGQYRKTERNIGVEFYRIEPDVQQAIDNARYWIENNTFSPDEIAVRFSHRLVAIHPFSNGNGRFSRLVGDLLAQHLGEPRFTWGQANLTDDTALRAEYVEALREADKGGFDRLVRFCRS